jgi:hypothetical protein
MDQRSLCGQARGAFCTAQHHFRFAENESTRTDAEPLAPGSGEQNSNPSLGEDRDNTGKTDTVVQDGQRTACVAGEKMMADCSQVEKLQW